MVAIKNHSMCNGQHPSTCQLQLEDDIIVQRFRDAGAIILGESHSRRERRRSNVL